jgi:galactokinase
VSGQETFRTEDIPLPAGYEIALCNTNLRKEKSASSEYNTRALECKIGLELLKQYFPNAQYLRDIPAETALHTMLPSSTTFQDLTQQLNQEIVADLFDDYNVPLSRELKILPRCRHVISENMRVLRGAECMKSGDIQEFGTIMRESYRSMRDDFAGSCDELDQMVEIALRFPGTLGARIAGAGWGGCAVAIVRTSDASAFQSQIARKYHEYTGMEGEIFMCQPGQGAGVL